MSGLCRNQYAHVLDIIAVMSGSAPSLTSEIRFHAQDDLTADQVYSVVSVLWTHGAVKTRVKVVVDCSMETGQKIQSALNATFCSSS